MNAGDAVELARQGQLYPALILHGGTDEARADLAVTFARTLLCERPAGERPCGECRHCRRILWPEAKVNTFHPDFMVLERDLATVTSVGATKDFLRGAQVSPFEARGQVFVIANAETLSGEAANALLKTLEEPPTSAPRHFLLLAPSQLDLLPTIRSRALALFLGSAPRPRGDDVDDLAGAFRDAVDAYRTSGNRAELLAAAAILEQSGSFKDARATAPWERAAAVVVEASRRGGDEGSTEQGGERQLLALAADLLGGPRLRVRGIRPGRILEGFVSDRLE